jgi:hypothetical protein
MGFGVPLGTGVGFAHPVVQDEVGSAVKEKDEECEEDEREEDDRHEVVTDAQEMDEDCVEDERGSEEGEPCDGVEEGEEDEPCGEVLTCWRGLSLAEDVSAETRICNVCRLTMPDGSRRLFCCSCGFDVCASCLHASSDHGSSEEGVASGKEEDEEGEEDAVG